MTTNDTNAFHQLQDLLDRYFLLQVLSPETAKRYELSMRNLATFIGGPTAHPPDIGLDRLDEDCLVGFRNWSLKRMKPISVSTERRHVSTLLNAAVRYGWISANPFGGVPSVPVSKPLSKAITRPDMRAHNMDAFFKRLAAVVPVELGRSSAHRVRHTTATVLANSVPNLRLVQQQLGHQSIAANYWCVYLDLPSMRSALAALSAPNV